jgi:hypothetical protein
MKKDTHFRTASDSVCLAAYTHESFYLKGKEGKLEGTHRSVLFRSVRTTQLVQNEQLSSKIMPI